MLPVGYQANFLIILHLSLIKLRVGFCKVLRGTDSFKYHLFTFEFLPILLYDGDINNLIPDDLMGNPMFI